MPDKQPWWRSGGAIAVLSLAVFTIPVAWVLTALRKDWSRRRRWSTAGASAVFLVAILAVAPGTHPASPGPAQNAAVAAPSSATTTVVAPVSTDAPPTSVPSPAASSAASGTAPTATTSAPAHPATHPTTHPASTSATATTKPATAPAAPTKTSTSAPIPTDSSSDPAALGGSCAHHTTGACGWTAGVPPISAGETATCKDGTPSFSAHFSGTCSGHGGVEYWYE